MLVEFKAMIEGSQKEESQIECEVEKTTPKSKGSSRKQPAFFNHMKHSRFLLIKALYYLFYSVWMVVVVIGLALVWILSWLLI